MTPRELDDSICERCGQRNRHHPDGKHPVSVPPEAARENEVAEGTLSVNADAIEVRKRFDVLMERMDEFYPEQGMWDAQVVACYLVQEARFHVDVLRALCGEAAQCTFEVDSDAARELTVRLNQAWCGEDPVGAASQGEAERGGPSRAEVQTALMEAIEQGVTAAEIQHKSDIPSEYIIIDYAGIVGKIMGSLYTQPSPAPHLARISNLTRPEAVDVPPYEAVVADEDGYRWRLADDGMLEFQWPGENDEGETCEDRWVRAEETEGHDNTVCVTAELIALWSRLLPNGSHRAGIRSPMASREAERRGEAVSAEDIKLIVYHRVCTSGLMPFGITPIGARIALVMSFADEVARDILAAPIITPLYARSAGEGTDTARLDWLDGDEALVEARLSDVVTIFDATTISVRAAIDAARGPRTGGDNAE